MTDLMSLLSSLVESGTGRIKVAGVTDDVRPVTSREEKMYTDIEFNLEHYKNDCKVKSVSNTLLEADKKLLLMKRWRHPTLSIHGIEGKANYFLVSID